MSNDTNLPVAEWFRSLQGEGPTAGTPAVFLRLGGCNLLCGAPENAAPDTPQSELSPNEEAGATWVCDTIELWQNADTTTLAELLTEWRSDGTVKMLRRDTTRLVLTGGEPLLHMDELAELCATDELADVAIEVETNGTIVPTDAFDSRISQYNVSVKLANSGMPESRRLIGEALEFHTENPDSAFKFVVSSVSDIDEIRDLIESYDISPADVYLMPAGASKTALEQSRPTVADMCKTHGFHYSPRLHVNVWNQATGV